VEADAERVDGRRFERLIGVAQHALAEDPARAVGLFEEALRMWRGAPLVEFRELESVRFEADRLEELRAVAVEGLVEARLGCGEHREVVGHLTGLVAENPLRERPRELLMLALYRGGRHAEALAAYRDACAALDEIGLQPSPELRALEAAILRHDESLVAVPVRSDRGDDGREPDARSSERSHDLPMSGRVTMLFTDIEGSTRPLHRLGESYQDLLVEHHRVLREAIDAAKGHEVGEAGDSFFAVFGRAADAIKCARDMQLRLGSCQWPGEESPRVRIGVHTGTPSFAQGRYIGIDVHRAARVMSAAYGGQVLLTAETVGALGRGAQVRELGFYRLKDLPAPEHLFQLPDVDLPARFPPLRAVAMAGGHGEALATYRDASQTLDEIGPQPGPELRQLDAAILQHD
jgi:class 3 adenylate cyclase